MTARVRALLAQVLVFGSAWGCKASVSADANASGSADGSLDGSASADADLEAEKGELRAQSAGSGTHDSATASEAGTAMAGKVLLGARHDLQLEPGRGTVSCQCLSVALGGARSAGMQWRAAPPELDDATQLVIALSSEGTTCKDEPKGSLGASYWGYRISGNDVIVFVESARSGRPLTSGAVIPRPVGTGQVFVKPASKALPYGRALDGKSACQVGNPGQVRSAGFSQLELGADAPGQAAQPSNQNDVNDIPTTIEMPSD